MSISTLVIIALLSHSSGVLSTCVYTHPNGYSLRWLVLGENVLFKLENSNVSANEYTGVGFGEATGNDMDRIIVQLNNSGVSVFELSSHPVDSPPQSCNEGSLITLDRRYKNRKIQADFSRPIITNSSNLNACQTWSFITAPTKIADGTYYVNSTNSNSLQVCNVAEECNVLKLMNATISPSPVPEHPEPRPFREPQVASSSGLSPSFPRTTYPAILPLEPLQLLIFERMLRKKRQTGYTPTNNIYGYDYNSSPASPSEAARLVLNPNYAYLNDALSEGYARNYVQAETQYSQSGQVGGQAGGYKAYDAVPSQSAILSNEQQNAINYQQIRQNNPGSSNTPAYSGNYYGGALSDAPQKSVVQGGFQQPASNNFVRPSYTPATSLGYSASSPAPYQSVVDLKTTRLRDPTAQAYYSDVSSTGNAQAMYYPYRTPTNVQSYSNNAQSYGINTQSLAGSGVYRDAATNPCSLEDPYWCDYYVRIYMNSSITLSGYGKQTVCQSLKQSLQDSYNGCCHAVQAAGCV
nr:DOMON domain containing protein [Haemonchus contortus]